MNPIAGTLALPPEASDAPAEGAPPLLYWTIYQTLLKQILGDQHAIGKDLPIERLLAEHFGVSRFTVRQALDLLEKDGYIRKQRAKPARVVSRSASIPAERPLRSLSDILRPLAIQQTRVESYETTHNAHAARLLAQSEDAPLYLLRLFHGNNERQIGFSEIYFPQSIGALLTRANFDEAASAGPLFVYPVVEARSGLKIDHAKVTVGADPASKALHTGLAPLLGNHPLVRVQYVFFSQDKPIQVSINWLDSRVYSVGYELSI
ncbi:GntR family transcriptional regulator [Pollutimonas bauzanensis]|uniref:GntR family transcriptional regulator n=1 Tax=Pollutimonas bauzanensis TaxID=658167 RepID=UPI00333EA49B